MLQLQIVDRDDTITQESFEHLASYWANTSQPLKWNSIFVLPLWLKTWWQQLASGAELYLGTARQGEKLIGIAPLIVKDGRASFLGSADVCDYLDFIVAPEKEGDFLNLLLKDLKARKINHLDLGLLRPDATVLTHLAPLAESLGYQVLCQQEDVSVELELPSTWEKYLATLNTKQRHEVRRKLRRLSQAGNINCYFVREPAAIPASLDTFFKMFAESRRDKAAFLTTQRESFFKSLAETMAEAGLLRLGVLELDNLPVAMTMCFDYNDCVYLYNSGYHPEYSSLSAGLICKVLCIKQSIEEGKKRFDFLKGRESYKYHLGGKETPLYRCQIMMR